MSLLVISAGRAATALPAMHHAEGGIRTPMGLRPLRPERSASTSSTTSACFPTKRRNIEGRLTGGNREVDHTEVVI